MRELLSAYIDDLCEALRGVDPAKIETMARKILEVRSKSRTVYLLGNGGSSATPSHSAGDWTKELGLRAVCLSDNTPSVTAYANDVSYDEVFRGQLEVFLAAGDLVIAYSGSGNSANVVSAVEFARKNGNYTIGLSGNYRNGAGGRLVQTVDLPIVVPTRSMERIEDAHLIINHVVKDYIKASIASRD